MSTLADRLRDALKVGRPEGRPLQSDSDVCRGGPSGPPETDVAEALDGEWHELDGQRYLVVERKYSPGYCHGRATIADLAPPDEGLWPSFGLLSADVPAQGRLMFLDLETTGLAGGAGTYAFLVGCGWFEGATFRTRQFFLSSFGDEAALLCGVAELARESSAIATYNGKSFDLPLIETRFVYRRTPTPFATLSHVDLLHPARKLWRSDDDAGEGGGCRLTSLERSVYGFERDGDIPGFELPSRYFHYVRTRDARQLAPVLEHNRLDLISLAFLAARVAHLLEHGVEAVESAREALGLGRLYERAGRLVDAKACYARAAGLDGADLKVVPYGERNARHVGADLQVGPDGVTRAEALRAYAVLCRRERRYEEAAGAWLAVLTLRGCPELIAREATSALAVHHEHRVKDAAAARRFALQSLQLSRTISVREALHHRVARLNRKLGLSFEI